MNRKQKTQADEACELMAAIIKRKGYALATERSYCARLRAFIRWLCDGKGKRFSTSDSRTKVEEFLTDEARRGCSASHQNGALHALIFWYQECRKEEIKGVNALRAKTGDRVRQAPPVEEIKRLLMAVQDTGQYPTRLITYLIYGCGLRLNETLSIRVKDIDLAAGKLVIVGGKGNKDRFINLPRSLIPQLANQIKASAALSEKAKMMGVPTKLPNLLAKKYPAAQFSKKWFWLFPQSQPCRDPRDKSMRVWWHCLPVTVQRAVKLAVKRAGIDAHITPHHLRHAWATHAYDAGARAADIQVILGHSDIKTTMRYIRPKPERVPSPLESIGVALDTLSNIVPISNNEKPRIAQ